MPRAKKVRLDSGMTLIEILVVLGLVAIVGGFSVTMSVDSFRKQIFRSDRDLLVSALHRARALAISNTCFGATCRTGAPHGVRIEQGRLVIFQGDSFDPSDEYNEVIEMTGGALVTGSPEIVFQPLSGLVTAPGEIVITDTGIVSTTTVGSEGQIFWTK